jgi:hypothetical protein
MALFFTSFITSINKTSKLTLTKHFNTKTMSAKFLLPCLLAMAALVISCSTYAQTAVVNNNKTTATGSAAIFSNNSGQTNGLSKATTAAPMTEINGVNAKDAASIIQNCLDLPGLQKYLTVDKAGNLSQLYVYYYHPILFPVDLVIAREGKSLQFKPVTMALNKITDDFMLFKIFETKENTASVSFEYYYDHAVSQKLIQVNLDLQKVGDSWTVSKTTLKN